MAVSNAGLHPAQIPTKVHSAHTSRGTLRSVPESSDIPAEETVEEVTPAQRRPGRRHVQREMHHLDRVVRHLVKDALKEADGLTREDVGAIRDLSREFRTDLQAVFHDAGRGKDFDVSTILSGVSSAMIKMTEGLRMLRVEPDDDTPVAPPPEELPPAPEADRPEDIESAVPGDLFEVSA